MLRKTWLILDYDLVGTGNSINRRQIERHTVKRGRTGTEFHLKFAVAKHFSAQFTLGITGFHYQQLTGDSGSGARLGDFKGRVTGIGPVMSSTFVVGKTPVITNLRWIHEFSAKRRLEGDIGFLSVTIPLGSN